MNQKEKEEKKKEIKKMLNRFSDGLVSGCIGLVSGCIAAVTGAFVGYGYLNYVNGMTLMSNIGINLLHSFGMAAVFGALMFLALLTLLNLFVNAEKKR